VGIILSVRRAMPTLGKILLAVLLLSIGSYEIWGCSCVPEKSVKKAFKAAATVFKGKVVEITKIEGESSIYRVKFNVDLSWKYLTEKEVTIETSQQTSLCDYSFTVGEEYLVYAKFDSNKTFKVSVCSRTNPIKSAQEDLKFLKKLRVVQIK
jgi:hypothetical protein